MQPKFQISGPFKLPNPCGLCGLEIKDGDEVYVNQRLHHPPLFDNCTLVAAWHKNCASILPKELLYHAP